MGPPLSLSLSPLGEREREREREKKERSLLAPHPKMGIMALIMPFVASQ